MQDTQIKKQGSVFEWKGIPPMQEAMPLALQHVVAMIVGCVTPPIMIANACGLDDREKIILIQSSLVIAALATLLQLFPIKRFAGSGLPVILGTSFAYVPTLMAIAKEFDLPTILGAQICGGLAAVIFGIFIKRLRKFFPALVTGTVVFTIGLSLYPTAVNMIAGGSGSAEFGNPKNWAVALITLIVVIVLTHFTTGFFKLAAILCGIVVGYIIALCLNMVDFSSIGSAGWVQFPTPLHFGLKFEPTAIISMVIMYIVNSVQAIGDFSATTAGAMNREPTDVELSGGIVGNGIASLVGGLFGALPTATFSQNVGIVSVTKVINRVVLTITSSIILLAGLVPKFSALLTTIPQCVIGGATISVFASITMTGIKLVASAGLTARNTAIVGLAVALGIGITQVPASLAMFPSWVGSVFGSSSVVISTLVAVALNLVIPKDKEA